jgi:hypothetical protein
MTEGDAAPDVIADSARRRAWLRVPRHGSWISRALVGVRNESWLARRWRSLGVRMEDEIETPTCLVVPVAEFGGGKSRDHDE